MTTHSSLPVYDWIETRMDEGQETKADPHVVDEWFEGLLSETILLEHKEHNLGSPTRHEENDHQNQHLDHL